MADEQSGSSWTLASGLCAPEGPVVAPGGWILNVCSLDPPEADWPTKGGDIAATRWERPGETTVLFNTSTETSRGIPAALAFGPDGCLYVTDEGRRSIIRVRPDGLQEDFVTAMGEERLNGPNDLSFDEDGNLFFSDPWTSSLDNPVGGVYGLAWASGELSRIDAGMAFPNGVVVRDGLLYVAETYPCKVWVYEVAGPGRATGKREFCSLPHLKTATIHGPDGMAFDAEGNLYVTHYGAGGVFVYGPDAQLVETIATPGAKPTNVCFGGPRHDSLVVTVDDLAELRVFELGVCGGVLNFCPREQPHHPWAALLPAA